MNAVARAEARIKQLCCLGLPGEAIIPSVLKELHAVVPSHGNTFFWCDEHYQLSNIYEENPTSVEIAELYAQEFYNRPDRELNPGFTYTMRHLHGVLDPLRINLNWRTYLKSDVYNLLIRPMGCAYNLYLVVRAGERALGGVAVWRGLDDVEFTARDKQRLERLGPFIAHALSAYSRDEINVPLVEDESRGLVIVDRYCKVQYASPEARKLLFLASHLHITKRTVQGEDAQLPAEVVRLCRKLSALFEGKQTAVSPPVWHHRNSWGGFTFRTYWLDNSNALDSLIGITIEHQVAMPVKIIRNMERLPALSRRQMQICLLQAAGYSHSEIARQMGTSVNTVIGYNRRIFDKFDVHSRTELINKLLGA